MNLANLQNFCLIFSTMQADKCLNYSLLSLILGEQLEGSRQKLQPSTKKRIKRQRWHLVDRDEVAKC